MAAKYFCDVCNNEMETEDFQRVRRELDRLAVEVIVRNDGLWNGGHVCHECVIKTVVSGAPMTDSEDRAQYWVGGPTVSATHYFDKTTWEEAPAEPSLKGKRAYP